MRIEFNWTDMDKAKEILKGKKFILGENFRKPPFFLTDIEEIIDGHDHIEAIDYNSVNGEIMLTLGKYTAPHKNANKFNLFLRDVEMIEHDFKSQARYDDEMPAIRKLIEEEKDKEETQQEEYEMGKPSDYAKEIMSRNSVKGLSDMYKKRKLHEYGTYATPCYHIEIYIGYILVTDGDKRASNHYFYLEFEPSYYNNRNKHLFNTMINFIYDHFELDDNEIVLAEGVLH